MKNSGKLKLTTLILTGVLMTALVGCASPKKTPVPQTPETKTESLAAGQTQAESATAAESSETTATESSPFKNMKTMDLDKNEVDSSIFAENKLTLVNTWNIGCTGCVQELPTLNQINKDYADKGVAVKGLYYNFESEISDEECKSVKEVLAKAGADFTQLRNSKEMLESKELKNFQIFPTTFFVDSEGNIVHTVEGSGDYKFWEKHIEKALEKVENNA